MVVNPNRSRAWLCALAIFFLVLGARLWQISRFGSSVPYWDQWDAEAAALLIPILHGNFPWQVLAAAHNEHRILFTRLLTVLLFQANQQWDPLLEMTFNTSLIALSAVVLWLLLRRAVSRELRPLLAAVIALVYVLPFCWENTLEGFGSQFYFVLLFSFGALAWLLGAPPFSGRWWAGALFALAACFSMASGVFASVATLGILLLRMLIERGSAWRRDVAGAAVCAAVIAIALASRVSNSALSAQSAHTFRMTVCASLAWPNMHSQISAAVLWIPALIFFVQFVRQGQASAGDRVLAGLILWSVLVALAIGYSRGASGTPPTSRYMDSLAVGLICNFAVLMRLRGAPVQSVLPAWDKALSALILVWVALAGAGFAKLTNWNLTGELPVKREFTNLEVASVRQYLETGDKAAFVHKQPWEIPYPNPDRLIDLLADPALQSVLPGPLQPHRKADAILRGRLQSLYESLLDVAPYVCLAGLLLLLAAWLRLPR